MRLDSFGPGDRVHMAEPTENLESIQRVSLRESCRYIG